jgi:hypothetical protein
MFDALRDYALLHPSWLTYDVAGDVFVPGTGDGVAAAAAAADMTHTLSEDRAWVWHQEHGGMVTSTEGFHKARDRVAHARAAYAEAMDRVARAKQDSSEAGGAGVLDAGLEVAAVEAESKVIVVEDDDSRVHL